MKQEELEYITVPETSSHSESNTPKATKKSEKKKSKSDSDSKKEDKKKKEKEKEKKEKKEKAEKKETKEKKEDVSEISTDSIADNYSDSIFAADSDSIAIDSSLVKVDSVATTAKKDTVVTVAPPAYLSGNNPVARINHPGHDSGIMFLITITFILVSYSFNHYRRLLAIYGHKCGRHLR